MINVIKFFKKHQSVAEVTVKKFPRVLFNIRCKTVNWFLVQQCGQFATSRLHDREDDWERYVQQGVLVLQTRFEGKIGLQNYKQEMCGGEFHQQVPTPRIKVNPNHLFVTYRTLRVVSRIISNIEHPNIVKIHEILEIHHNIYIFMDYCANGDLLEYIKIRGPLSQEKAKVYFRWAGYEAHRAVFTLKTVILIS